MRQMAAVPLTDTLQNLSARQSDSAVGMFGGGRASPHQSQQTAVDFALETLNEMLVGMQDDDIVLGKEPVIEPVSILLEGVVISAKGPAEIGAMLDQDIARQGIEIAVPGKKPGAVINHDYRRGASFDFEHFSKHPQGLFRGTNLLIMIGITDLGPHIAGGETGCNYFAGTHKRMARCRRSRNPND